MKKIALLFMLTVMLIIGTASAQETETENVVLRVERGDSYSNLFGRDWHKAWLLNRIVVLRNGSPVSTPDILIEGMTVTVGRDVELTPRAKERSERIQRAKRDLASRLETLDKTLTRDPEITEAVNTARHDLDQDLNYGGDLKFVAREVERLETAITALKSSPSTQADAGPPTQVTMLPVIALSVLTLSLLFYWLARRSQLPKKATVPPGQTRFDDAWRDLSETFDLATESSKELGHKHPSPSHCPAATVLSKRENFRYETKTQ